MIRALRRLRQEDYKLEASLYLLVRFRDREKRMNLSFLAGSTKTSTGSWGYSSVIRLLLSMYKANCTGLQEYGGV